MDRLKTSSKFKESGEGFLQLSGSPVGARRLNS